MASINIQLTEDDIQEDTGGGFEPIPKGIYHLALENAELKSKEDYDTQEPYECIEVKIRVQGPTHSNRVLFDNFVIKHSGTGGKQAEKEVKGRRKLGSLLLALGIPYDRFTDSDQLIGGEALADVGVMAANGDYKARNIIYKYKPLDGGSAAPAPAPVPRAAAPAPRPAAPAKAAPPWATKK